MLKILSCIFFSIAFASVFQFCRNCQMAVFFNIKINFIYFFYSPVPSYNWTRKHGNLPRDAKFLSYNRVLILPSVEPADMGEYVCRAVNDKLAIENSISLSIQGKCKIILLILLLFKYDKTFIILLFDILNL